MAEGMKPLILAAALFAAAWAIEASGQGMPPPRDGKWFLVMAIVVGGDVVQASGMSFATRDECTAGLIVWEAKPATGGITNWYAVCIPGHRGKPALEPGQVEL